MRRPKCTWELEGPRSALTMSLARCWASSFGLLDPSRCELQMRIQLVLAARLMASSGDQVQAVINCNRVHT